MRPGSVSFTFDVRYRTGMGLAEKNTNIPCMLLHMSKHVSLFLWGGGDIILIIVIIMIYLQQLIIQAPTIFITKRLYTHITCWIILQFFFYPG